MRRFASVAMRKVGGGAVIGVVLGALGCGGGVAPGEACDTKGEQACADNKEMRCGEDETWFVAEDCGDKSCVINDEGDADCE